VRPSRLRAPEYEGIIARHREARRLPMGATTLDAGWDIPIGAHVFTADGRKLGVVAGADAYELVVEDGLFLRRTYAVRLSDVDRYEEGALILSLMMEEIAQTDSEGEGS